jgi:hypothetical protein
MAPRTGHEPLLCLEEREYQTGSFRAKTERADTYFLMGYPLYSLGPS